MMRKLVFLLLFLAAPALPAQTVSHIKLAGRDVALWKPSGPAPATGYPIIVFSPDPGAFQLRKAELEVQKLELAGLKGERIDWPAGVLAFLGGVVGAVASFLVSRWRRLGALDQAVHEKRLESYPHLVKATSQLAVYFPGGDPPGAASVGPEECAAMGRAMSEWYFEGGGLLLSVEARDAYFRLARALTRASLAKPLKVPTFPRDADDISLKKVDAYRAALEEKEKLDLDDVENWKFGSLPSKAEAKAEVRQPHLEFKDYVFLQRFSSLLRTALAEDLHSRRRPAA